MDFMIMARARPCARHCLRLLLAAFRPSKLSLSNNGMWRPMQLNPMFYVLIGKRCRDLCILGRAC
jgi:hypothetical protein